MSTHTSTQTIATMRAALEFLTANYTTLEIKFMQKMRADAMNMGRVILDDSDSSREEFDAAYDLIMELDRVGY